MLPLILNGVLLVLGLLMLREFRIAMLSIRALRWRSTSGELANETNSSETPGESLQYSYSVEGEDYQSQQLGFGYPTGTGEVLGRTELVRVLANAPSVTVYYDPRRPDVSVLMNGFKLFHALRMLLILIVLLGLWGLGVGVMSFS